MKASLPFKVIKTTKNDKWYVVFDYKDNAGKRKRKWVKTGISKKSDRDKENEKLLDAKVSEIVEEFIKNFGNENGKCNSIPVAQQPIKVFIDSWFADIKSKVARTTFQAYKSHLKCFLEFVDQKYPNITISDVDHVMVQEYLNSKLDSGAKNATIKQYYLTLHTAFSYAVSTDLIEKHPLDKLKVPRAERYEAAFYNKDEINRLFKAFDGDIIEIVVHIAAYYGLRRCEILGLRWDAIDFQNKTITIQRKVVEVTDENGKDKLYVETRLKTSSTRRTLPLIPHIEEMLLAKKKSDEYFRKCFGKEYNTEFDGFICRKPNGKLLTPAFITSHFRYIVKSKGLRYLRFHDLRHSCASLMLANDIPMKAIQEWLGHSNFSITANLYSHLEYNAKIASAETIARVLGDAEENDDNPKPKSRKATKKPRKGKS